jgi:AcrR family transcriptional regulator
MASHRAILDASCALLAEGGLPALTIDRVVARAGVSKATIYRRWASKQDLALAALEHCSPEPRAPRTGRVREDLVELLRTDLGELVGTPLGRVLPGLIGDPGDAPGLREEIGRRFLAPRAEALTTALAEGVRRGELRADLDVDMASGLLAGPVLWRLATDRTVDLDLAERLVDTVLEGLRAG